MDPSSGTKKKGQKIGQIKEAAPTAAAHRSENKTNANNAPLEKDKSHPSEVQHPKINLKLETCTEKSETEMDKTQLDSGTQNLSLPNPGVNFGVPPSPGVFDLQSPVVIIGEDVFQIIDDCPPPPAPFPHRFVSLRTESMSDLYDLNMDDILGGGRFGEVHICTEKATGMQLVAKVLKVQSERDREMALNEINVMNQLDHLNLIQMFDAIETPNEIFLLLEYVGGGELFERIIDDSYQLMEVDAMVFVRQICIFYMHQMYVLHLGT
ncbi:unnamed protein product [Staurois parvus]|uniref:Protein kinase domain-containing protein n=1 Tax=Staurois parvus TaxID=386267 RepID=A0ABN9FKY4_9NEOB|nr:unnamed protein product [Staurois parvus]